MYDAEPNAVRSGHWHLPPDTRHLCRSTIACYITALPAQIQWLGENAYGSLITCGPADVDLRSDIFFLEISSQGKKLLPRLYSETHTRVEKDFGQLQEWEVLG